MAGHKSQQRGNKQQQPDCSQRFCHRRYDLARAEPARSQAPRNTGTRNAPMPKPCNIRSETIAPTRPIQFRAAREPVRTEALLNEGSSGEYEASARKSSRAETQSRNPISSLSRRLFVGANICEKYFIDVCSQRRKPPRSQLPERIIMSRTRRRNNEGIRKQYRVGFG